MRTNPLVTVIIPVRTTTQYLSETIKAIQANDYDNYEIIILPDAENKNQTAKKLRYISSGLLGPAEKRDLGASKSKGEILAFIDDDAYPSEGWLSAIVSNFKDNSVAGVGGPGITPPNVDWQEEVSGWSSASPIGAGPYTYRFIPGKKRYVDDYPSMNLSVRKSDFLEVGGFDSTYYPGEDTKLCLDLVHKLGKKIIYDPNAIVYHHRRPIWLPHLAQHGNFGIHRGYFARVLPQTSFRIVYFLPSLFLLYTIVFLLSTGISSVTKNFSSAKIIGLIVPFILYASLIVLNAFWIMKHSSKLYIGILSMPVIVLTHLWYGVQFMKGYLFTRSLPK